MRHTQAEKMEVIRLVEESVLSIRRSLKEFGIAISTFYSWYHRYCEDGYDGPGRPLIFSPGRCLLGSSR